MRKPVGPLTSLADLDQADVVVPIAAATLLVPLAFLVVAMLAWSRRNRGQPVGRGLEALLALLVGAVLGTLGLWSASSVILAAPLVLAFLFMAVTTARRRRRVLSGWLVFGFALPWTLLWLVYVLALIAGARFESVATWGAFVAGLAVILLGLVIVGRGDPPGDVPVPADMSDRVRARSFGIVARAIYEPAQVGPLRTTELAAVVAMVVTWTVIAFLPTPNRVINIALAIVVSAALATEAYIRAMPDPMRRAYEAFSWFGEWELARFRALTGSGVPLKQGAARRWLRDHPERPEIVGFRAEVMLFAGQFDEARAAVERMPAGDAFARFERVSLSEVIDWMSGGDGDLPGLEAAVADLGPLTTDDRLRGEVALATARVRHLAVEGPLSTATLAPLREVRTLLGKRADGQVGRALRRRMLPVFLAFGVVFGVISALLNFGPW